MALAFGPRRAKTLGCLSVQLVSRISNLGGPDPPTSKTDGQTVYFQNGEMGLYPLILPVKLLINAPGIYFNMDLETSVFNRDTASIRTLALSPLNLLM